MTSILALFLAASVHAAPSPAPAETPLPLDGLQTFGAMVLQQRDYATVEKVALEGLRDYPSAAAFHLMLGEVYASKGRYADAFYELQWEMIQAGPGSETGEAAARYCAELLEVKSGERREVMAALSALEALDQDPEKAVEGIESVEKTHGKRLALEVYRAEALRNAGRTEEAVTAYRGVIAHTPSFVPAYVELARVESARGHEKDATSLLEKAREIDAHNWSLRSRR